MQARKCLITLKAGFGPNLVDKTLNLQRLLFNFLFLCVSKSYLMIQWYIISSCNGTMGKSIWLQLWLSLTLDYIHKSLDRRIIIMQEFPNRRGAAMPEGVTVAACLSAAAPFAKVTHTLHCCAILFCCLGGQTDYDYDYDYDHSSWAASQGHTCITLLCNISLLPGWWNWIWLWWI